MRGGDAGATPNSLERVARGNRPVLKATLKPLRALGRASVGEGFRIHRAAGHALQTIVPNRRRSLQACIPVSGFQDVSLLG